MTIQEIEEFVQGELSYLDLSTKQKEKYIAFVKKMNDYYYYHNMSNVDIKNILIEKLEDCLELFKMQGFDEETALRFTKNAVLESDRKNFKEKIAFLRVINFEESVIINDCLSIRFSLEKSHAKKMHLVSINDTKHQTRNVIIHEVDSKYEKRFNTKMSTLTNKYPITKEIKDVWMIIAMMDDKSFENYFKLTRDELSQIYPTTKDEIATLHFIANLTDEEINNRYGITRQELLQKHPINNDTLKALKSIKQSSDKAIVLTFHKTREELLQLRTITTEMIKLAQKERLSLKRNTYTKEELKEQFKTLKKELI